LFNSEQNVRVSSFPPVTALGIDIGSTNTKAAMVEVNGTEVTEVAVLTRPTPARGDELLACVAGLIGDVVGTAARPPEAVGIAAMAETGVVWGDPGPAGPLLRWDAHDPALARAAGVLVAQLGAPALYAATGAPVPAKTPLARWYALRAAGHDGALRWAGVAELVGWALTGELATDHTLAQRTMAYRLPEPGGEPAAGFDAELLAEVGMKQHDLPRVVAPGRAIGAVRTDAARAFGLPAGLPVFIAGHDHAVGAWAVGVRSPGDAGDSVGTAEALLRVAEAGVDREAARRDGLSLGRDVTGRFETVLAGNPSAGALLAQLVPRPGDGIWPDPAGPVVPVWPVLLPYPRGRQSPCPAPRARLGTVGPDGSEDPLPDAPAELLRCALQGLALQLRWMDAAVSRAAGDRGVRLTVFGGPGARNPAALAFKRALLPGALAMASVGEPVASGAALFAAVRADLADPAAALHSEPVPGAPAPAFDEVFARFVRSALADR
jgi:xylulokinase